VIEEGPAAGTTVETDVAVVGGGPAGIALTLRLAEHGLRVCLLESGGPAYEPASQSLARADTVGTPYYPIHETRIRALGGSSWSWGGICTPLDEMADRPWVEHAAWPFASTELTPYLDEAYSLCGIDAEQRRAVDETTADRWEAAGLDDRRVCPVPVYFSRPTRFGPTYHDRLAALPNVRVLLHSTVIRIDHADGRAEHLEVRGPTGTFRVSARRFVLAAGGVENPRILMVAGIGGDAVGRFFMEHPRVCDRFRVRPGNTPLGRLVGGGAAGTLRFFRLSIADAMQREECLLTYHANVQFGYADQLTAQWTAARRMIIALRSPWKESPFYQDAGGGRIGLRSADLATAARRPDRTIRSAVGAVTEWPRLRRYVEIWSALEQVPESSNRVELTSETDRFGVPRARVLWTVGQQEEATYRRALAVVLGEFEKLEPGISSARVGEDPWPGELVGNWHHEGTTRMDPDPSRGAVDADCRVHGLSNLFVAGSSVFPTSGSTSPTITILQLALRLADHLTADLGHASASEGTGEESSTAAA